MQRTGAAHGLEAVKFAGIMAPGDHDGAVGLQMHAEKYSSGVGTTPISVTSHPVDCKPSSKRVAGAENSGGNRGQD